MYSHRLRRSIARASGRTSNSSFSHPAAHQLPESRALCAAQNDRRRSIGHSSFHDKCSGFLSTYFMHCNSKKENVTQDLVPSAVIFFYFTGISRDKQNQHSSFFRALKRLFLFFLKPSHLVLLIKVSSFFHTAAEFTTSAPIYCVIHGLFSDDLLPLSHTSNLEFEIPVQFHREIKVSALMW